MALLWRAILVSAVAAGSQALAVPAPAPVVPAAPPAGSAPVSVMSLVALKTLEPGLWQLEVQGKAPRQMCVAEAAALVQVEHDQPGCSRFVISNEPKSATIHYSCQRAGWGRTTVRVETASAAVIHTQGISRNAPFDYSVQARRLGGCGAQAALKQR